MAVVPGTTQLAWQYVSDDGFNFESVLRAIKLSLMTVTPGPLKEYDANFAGLTRALFDLSMGLQGHLASSVVYPPLAPGGTTGANAIPGNVAGVPPYLDIPLRNGSFVFDTRQGRLFVVIDRQLWQTNGAESLVHIGNEPPRSGPQARWLQRNGQLWLDSRDGRTYVYADDPVAQGQPGWYELPATYVGPLSQTGAMQPQPGVAQPAAAGAVVEGVTPPPNPARGDLWVDLAAGTPQLMIFDGVGWHPAVHGDGVTVVENDPTGTGVQVQLAVGVVDLGTI